MAAERASWENSPAWVAANHFTAIQKHFAVLQRLARERDMGAENQERLGIIKKLCQNVEEKYLTELTPWHHSVSGEWAEWTRGTKGKSEIDEATGRLPGALNDLEEAGASSQPDPAAAGAGVGAAAVAASAAASGVAPSPGILVEAVRHELDKIPRAARAELHWSSIGAEP